MKNTETIFTVTNDKFSRDPYDGTFDEIVENIIECNESWETEYTKDDFTVTSRGIMCDDEIIAEYK